MRCDLILLDIDECATGVHTCKPNEHCINKNGTYVCQCYTGYQLFNGSCKGNEEDQKMAITCLVYPHVISNTCNHKRDDR